jgi:hypothetical protein
MAILYVGIDLAKNVFAAHGQTVRLITPKFVTPYRMSGARSMTEAADAAACWPSSATCWR